MGDRLCHLARSRLLEPTSELATRQERSGLSVLAELRAAPATAHVPVIVFSGQPTGCEMR
jgi:hypothetical protein